MALPFNLLSSWFHVNAAELKSRKQKGVAPKMSLYLFKKKKKTYADLRPCTRCGLHTSVHTVLYTEFFYLGMCTYLCIRYCRIISVKSQLVCRVSFWRSGGWGAAQIFLATFFCFTFSSVKNWSCQQRQNHYMVGVYTGIWALWFVYY